MTLGSTQEAAPSHLLAHVCLTHAWRAPSGAFRSAAWGRSMELSQKPCLVPRLCLGRYLEPVHTKGKTKQNTTYQENVTICSLILFFLTVDAIYHES